MDGSAIFGQAEAADKDAKTDPKPVDSAQRPGTPSAANDDAEALLGAGQIRDEFQNERGIRVHMDRSRDANLTVLGRSDEHTSELQSLMRTSYAVCCV